MKINNELTLNKNTAYRIGIYCEAIAAGYEVPDIPKSPYTFAELRGKTIEEKIENYTEAKFAVGTELPKRKDIRDYNRVRDNFGTTHSERMNKILQAKMVILGETI